jgi:hypothetical protein
MSACRTKRAGHVGGQRKSLATFSAFGSKVQQELLRDDDKNLRN